MKAFVQELWAKDHWKTPDGLYSRPNPNFQTEGRGQETAVEALIEAHPTSEPHQNQCPDEEETGQTLESPPPKPLEKRPQSSTEEGRVPSKLCLWLEQRQARRPIEKKIDTNPIHMLRSYKEWDTRRTPKLP